MNSESLGSRYIKVPNWRRGAAFLIDFMAAAILSLLLGASWTAHAFVFVITWLGLRVVLVLKNRGQSLGRWALDMRIVDLQYGGTPLVAELSKREGLIGLEAFLALLGLVNLSPAAPWSVLLLIPLATDCGLAWLDPLQRQSFHDRIARTMVVQTRRGFSLDLKVKRALADATRRMKQ